MDLLEWTWNEIPRFLDPFLRYYKNPDYPKSRFVGQSLFKWGNSKLGPFEGVLGSGPVVLTCMDQKKKLILVVTLANLF